MVAGKVVFTGEFDSSLAEKQIEDFRRKLETIKINVPASAISTIAKQIKTLNTTPIKPKLDKISLDKLKKDLSDTNIDKTIAEQIETLNKSVIVPQVDHQPLEGFNAHLDLKEEHWDDLNDHFAKKPLKPKIDNGGMALSLKEVDQQQQEIKQQINIAKTSLKTLEKTPLGTTGVTTEIKKETDKINLDKTVANQQVTAVSGFSEAVSSFKKSTEEFKKANRRTLLGSLFRGAAGFIGMSLGQLLVAKLGGLFVKTTSQLASKGLEGEGNIASRGLAQAMVKGGAYKLAYETVPVKDIQALLIGTFAIGKGLEEVSLKLSQQEGKSGEFFGKTASQLNKMNSILFDTFTEVTVGDLIVTNLKMIKQAITKGLGMGLTKIVASAFQAIVTAPAKMLAGAFAKTGADQASVTTTAFKQALDRLLTGQTNTEKKDDSVRKGFITAGLLKGLMRLPMETIKFPVDTLIKGFKQVFPRKEGQQPNLFTKAWQRVSSTIGQQLEGFNQFFAQIGDIFKLTEKGLLDMAQDVLGVTLEQVKEQIEQDEAISVEDILKQILSEIKEIKALLSGLSIVGEANQAINEGSTITEEDLNIEIPEPITAQELSRAILPLIDRLRRQGTRVGESPKSGGIVALANDLPELNLETKGKRVDDLKAELKQIITAIGDADNLKQLEEIAEYLVRNWEKVSKQEHKNYAPDVTGGTSSERLNFGDNTNQIQDNWETTGDEIVTELNRLVAISRKAGYQVQRNISEGSPGITKWIRQHWRKTIVFIAKAIRSLEPFTKDIGGKIAKNFEEVGKRIGNIFEQGKEVVSKFNLSSTFENVKGKVAGVMSSAREKVSQSSLPTVSLPEFEMPSIKLPDIDLDNIFGELKNKLNEVIDKLKAEFDKLSQINIQELTEDFGKNINDLWINLSKTIDSQKAIIIEKAKVNYKKVYDKAVNHLISGLASAIISIETIQSKLPEVKIPAITLPSLDFKASFESIKQKINEQLDSNKAKLKQLFNIDYSGLKTSYIASIQKTWQSLLNTIKAQIPIIEAKAKESYTEIYNKTINNIVDGIGSVIIATSSIQPPPIEFSFDPLVSFFEGVKSKIEENENVITIISKVNNSIVSITRLIQVKFTEFVKSINTGINDISRKIQEKISSIDVDKIKNNAEVGIQNLANNLKGVLDQTNTLVFAQSVNDGIQSFIDDLITLFEGVKEKASNIPNVITFSPVISAIDSINENIDNVVKGLNKLAKITDFSGQIKELESTIKSLRFKLLFNSVKALKKITKFLDLEVNLDDGWKKNLVKFLTRGLYQVTKTSLRELGIALGQILSYVIKDLRALLGGIYNSQQFLPIKEDIESFVGQLQDVFNFAKKQLDSLTGFFNRGKKNLEIETTNDEKGNTVTKPKEEIYFQRLAKTIAQTLIFNTNRKGSQAIQSALGLQYSQKRTGTETLGVLIDKIEFDPSALKEVINVLEDNWEGFTLDDSITNPFTDLAEEMKDIDEKWGHTGNYFNRVLHQMSGKAKTEGYRILHYLAEGSPGLTQDIRNRWLETTRHVGKQMQGMAGQGESAFQRIIDVANGLKITGFEVGNSLYENIKGKLGNVADDLIEKGEIKVYELMGININDVGQIDNLVNNIKDKFNQLNDIERTDINTVLNRFSGTLNRRDNLAFKQVREQIKNLGDLRKDIQQRLANPPSFVDKNGKLDKRAILKYLAEVENKIRQYQVGLGNLTQTMEVDPNIQKVIEQLPLEARREFNSMFSAITSGFDSVEQLAVDFKSAMLDIINLDADALRGLGVPESFIEQIEKLAEKGELAREALDFSNFELPTIENTTAQGERALANISVNQARVKDIQSSQSGMRGQRTTIISDIQKTKAQFDKDYKRLIQQGKTVEARALKDAYRDYLKAKAEQLKEIKQVEARYAQELAQMAISLGDFESEVDVDNFIKGFITFSDGLVALAEKVSQGNEELKNEVISIANTVNNAVKVYQQASQEIISLENKLANIESRKSGINQKYDKLKQQAREANNLRLLVQLEQQRVDELNQLEQEQRQLNQQLTQQQDLVVSSRRTAFEETRGTSIADINAIYETETAGVEEEQLTLIDRFKAVLKEIPVLAQQAFGVIMAGYENLKQKLPIIQKMEDALRGMGLKIAGLAIGVVVGFNLIGKAISSGIQTAVNKIQELSNASFNAALELESMQAQFKFVFGEGQGLSKLQSFRDQTDKLGLSFKKMTGQFVQFTMGLQGANLDFMSEEMFEGVQKALRVRGASPEVADRALTALTQIANKGKVSLEELTGQLGEALPGALAVAADAMNVSTSELIKMVEQGRLLSEDFLPRFTQALADEASRSMEESLQTGTAKIERLGNTLTYVQEAMGKGTLDIAKPLIDGLNQFLLFMLEWGDKVAVLIAGIALQFLVPWKSVLIGLRRIFADAIIDIQQIWLLNSEKFNAGLHLINATNLSITNQLMMAWNKFVVVLRTVKIALIEIAKALLPMLIITSAIEFGSGLLNIGKEAEKRVKDVDLQYQKHLKTLEEIARKRKELAELDNQTPNQRLEIAQRETAKAQDSIDTGNFVFNAVDALIRRMNNTKNGYSNSDNRLMTYSRLELDAQILSASETYNKMLDSISLIENALNQSGGLNKFIEERARLEKEIATNASTINGLMASQNPLAREQAMELKRTNLERQKELKALKETYFPVGDWDDFTQDIQAEIDFLNQQIVKTKDPTGQLQKQVKLYEIALQSLEVQTEKVTDAVEGLKDSMGNIVRELGKVEAQFASIKFENDILASQEKTNLLNQQANLGLPSNYQSQSALAKKEFEILVRERNRLINESRSMASAITETKDIQTVTTLLTTLKSSYDDTIQTLEDVTYETILRALNNEGIKDNEKELLNQLKRQQELRQQVASSEEQIAQARVNIVEQNYQQVQNLITFYRSLEDLDVAVRDYLKTQTRATEDINIAIRDYQIQRIRGLEDFVRSVEDISIQYQRQQRDLVDSYLDLNRQLITQSLQVRKTIIEAQRDIEKRSIVNDLRSNLQFGKQGLFGDLFDAVDAFLQGQNEIKSEELTLEEQRLQIQEDIINIARQVRSMSEQVFDLERQRLTQMRDLTRQQIDLINGRIDAERNIKRQLQDHADQQADSLRGIQRQFEDMETQAKLIGVKFTNIFNMFDGINTNYSKVNQAITGLIGTVKGLRQQALKELANSRKQNNNLPTTTTNKTAPKSQPSKTKPSVTQSQARSISPVINVAQVDQALKIINNLPKTSTKGVTLDEVKISKDIMRRITKAIEKGDIKVNINSKGEIQSIVAKTPELANLLATGKTKGNYNTGHTFAYGYSGLAKILQNLKKWNTEEDVKIKQGSGRQPKQWIGSSNPFQQYLKNEFQMATAGMGDLSNGLIIPVKFEIADNAIIKIPDTTKIEENLKNNIVTPQKDLVDILDLQNDKVKEINLNQTKQLGDKLTELKLEELSLKQVQFKLKTTDQQRQLAIALVNALRTQSDTLRSQLDTYRNITKEVRELVRNAKGFLTGGDELNLTAENIEEKYRTAKKNIEDFQRTIGDLLTLAGTDPDKMAQETIDKIVNSTQFKELPKELQEQFGNVFSTFANNTAEGVKELQKLLDTFPKLKAELDKSYALELKVQLKQTEYQNVIKSLAILTASGNAMIEGLQVTSKPMADEMAIFVRQAERLSQFTERQAQIELQIEQTKLNILEAQRQGNKLQEKLHQKALTTLRQEQQTAEARRQSLDYWDAVNTRINSQVDLNNSLASTFRMIGELQSQNNPFGGGALANAEAERLEIITKYLQKFNELNQLEARYADNPQIVSSIRAMKSELEGLQQIELNKIVEKYNIFAQAIKEPMQQAFSSLFSDVLRGTKSIQDVLTEFLTSVANFFAQIAAQIATNAVMGFFNNLGLFGIAGFNAGGKVSNNKNGGTVKNYVEGGEVFNNVVNTGNLKKRKLDTVGNYAKGGEILELGLAVHQALKREGNKGVPVVASIGEQILSTRNQDAQVFRALQQSGEWERIKFHFKYQGDYVPNFADGGSVGNNSTSRTFNRNSSSNNVVYNYSMNISTPDANSFRKSQSLIAQERKLMEEKMKRFN